MKLFSMFVLMCVIPISVFAASPQDLAIDAFKADRGVATQITLIMQKFGNLTPGQITAVPIVGSCGVAGCQSSYLVVQELAFSGTNPYFTTVSALVDLPLGKPAKVARLNPLVP